MTIGQTTVTVTLEDNTATRALLQHLANGDVTVNTHRYGGFEQVSSFPWALPTKDTRITTSPGDVILYSGDQLVVFFGSNTWSYTRLGRIDNLSNDELRNLLDVANIKIVLSLQQTTAIREIQSAKKKSVLNNAVYDLQGRKIADNYAQFKSSSPAKGIYIVNGEKVSL